MKNKIIAGSFLLAMVLFSSTQATPDVQASVQVAMADDDGDEIEAREEMEKEKEDELEEETRDEERKRAPHIETSMMEECKSC